MLREDRKSIDFVKEKSKKDEEIKREEEVNHEQKYQQMISPKEMSQSQPHFFLKKPLTRKQTLQFSRIG